MIHSNTYRENEGDLPNFAGFDSTEGSVEMCPPRENARRVCTETAMAVMATAEMTDPRLAQLESDVADLMMDWGS